MAGNDITQSPVSTATILAVVTLTLIAVASVVIEVRPIAPAEERFIGHGDQADAALVARNIAEGNGPVTDCVWLLHAGGRPGRAVRHLEGYWSVYVAAALAPLFQRVVSIIEPAKITEASERQHIITFPVDDLGCNCLLASCGIGCYDGILKINNVQKLGGKFASNPRGRW